MPENETVVKPFRKVVRPCTILVGKTYASVFCEIKWNGHRLAIHGVEGPTKGGNAVGGCGQIVGTLDPDAVKTYAEGWDRVKFERFLAVWRAWHLNDMRAGTPRQEREIARREKRGEGPAPGETTYDWAVRVLAEVGLYNDVHPDANAPAAWYRYGSGWLYESVPVEALTFLSGLPEADREPAWV